MPKRVPIKVAKNAAQEARCSKIVMLLWDGERSHIVTYGATKQLCADAARSGQALGEMLGFDRPPKTVEEAAKLVLEFWQGLQGSPSETGKQTSTLSQTDSPSNA